MAMDEGDRTGVRNFRDFLLQYNKMTEHCFERCAANFNYRTLTDTESSCVESCSNKAVTINQKIMQTFMVSQGKRQEAMAEEFAKQQEQMRVEEEKSKAEQTVQLTESEGTQTTELRTETDSNGVVESLPSAVIEKDSTAVVESLPGADTESSPGTT